MRYCASYVLVTSVHGSGVAGCAGVIAFNAASRGSRCTQGAFNPASRELDFLDHSGSTQGTQLDEKYPIQKRQPE